MVGAAALVGAAAIDDGMLSLPRGEMVAVLSCALPAVRTVPTAGRKARTTVAAGTSMGRLGALRYVAAVVRVRVARFAPGEEGGNCAMLRGEEPCGATLARRCVDVVRF